MTEGARRGRGKARKKKKKREMEESVNEHAGCLEEASGAISQWAVSGLILGFKKKEQNSLELYIKNGRLGSQALSTEYKRV